MMFLYTANEKCSNDLYELITVCGLVVTIEGTNMIANQRMRTWIIKRKKREQKLLF